MPTPPPYTTLLFDNDGILVDTEHLHFRATLEAFAAVGGHNIPLTEETYFHYFLQNSQGTSKLAAAHHLSPAQTLAIQQARDALYQHLLEHEPLLIPGVKETLETLRPHFQMAVVTSSRRPHFEAIHRRTGLLPLFDFTITKEDYPNTKPAPDPYLTAIARSGHPAQTCLAIEDSPRGLQSAQAANLDCYIIPSNLTRQSPFPNATQILKTITDLPPLLLRKPSPI